MPPRLITLAGTFRTRMPKYVSNRISGKVSSDSRPLAG